MTYLLNNKKSPGFTIMEVLVGISLTAMVLLIIYQINQTFQMLFTKQTNFLEISQNSRVFYDRLTRELRQSADIVTDLPSTNSDPLNPPTTEIEFQDGHDDASINYIRYYLANHQLFRQTKYYYFSANPNIKVKWNSLDQFSNYPLTNISSDSLIAEYIENIQIYGDKVIYIDTWLKKYNAKVHFLSAVWGRNVNR